MRRRIVLQLIAVAIAAVAAAAGATIALGLDLDGDSTSRAAARLAATGQPSSSPSPAAGAPCGARAGAERAAVDNLAARRIYTQEATGTETRADASRVAGWAPLLRALAGGEQRGVEAAVHELVYMPRWHIVRLRVLSGGRVLADIGGPHILAPVSGALRSAGRHASFVMSVQDDLGYVKLVTRFIGTPVELYQQGSPVMGTLGAVPAAPGDGAHLTIAGHAYLASLVPVHAFPSGPLQAALFVDTSPSGGSCEAVRVAAWGSIARHVAARFHPLATHWQDLADLVRTVTGGRLFVRQGASHLSGGGPRRLPQSGSVRYEGRHWAVYSWQPLPNVRAYLLAP